MNLKTTTSMALALGLLTGPAWADMDAAKAFLDAEIGDQSTLTREEQEAEMQWYIDAAQPFAGMEIKVVSETITTHEYESQVLAPAFEKITGIKITHDLIGEGDVVEKLQTQMQSGENIYDAYVNDSDLIGTHWRYQQVRNLTDWMDQEGADVTIADTAEEAITGADLVVADTWVSMGVSMGDEDADAKRKLLQPFQVDGDLMAKAKPDALFMHCLPAHRGEEVTDEVMDGPHSVVWDEAENRLHAQKGILAWCLG